MKIFIKIILLHLSIALISAQYSDDDEECSDESPCVRFCCQNRTQCLDESSDYFNIELLHGSENLGMKNFTKLKGKPCTDAFKLEPNVYDYDAHEILTNGSILLNADVILTTDDYCILTDSGEPLVYVCYPDYTFAEKYMSYLMLVSVPFLVATFAIYAWFKDLRNLHGKCLMAYILSLTMMYISISLTQLSKQYFIDHELFCETVGFVLYVSILFCFFWLNVICFDIFAAFRRTMGHKNTEQKRFLLYCLYAFGVPIVFAIVAAIIDKNELIHEDYRIGMLEGNCFINHSRIIKFYYLYAPISIILVVNATLYGTTAYKIYKAKKETAIVRSKENRQSRKESDIENFFLYLRLFVIMGVIWLTEIISWIFEGNGNTEISVILDVMNCLQGLIIFFMFAWKRKVKKLIKLRSSSSGILQSRVTSRKPHKETSDFSVVYHTQMSSVVSDQHIQIQL